MTMQPTMQISDLLRQIAQRSPVAPALSFAGGTLTYRDLDERVERVAAGLQAGGVRPGDRVAYVGFNDAAFLETLFAANRLGACFLPINFRLTAPELAFIIQDAGVHSIVADGECASRLQPIRESLGCEAFLAVGSGAGTNHEGWRPYADLLSAGEVVQPDPGGDRTSPAILMYTSGTTGQPKGARLTAENVFWNFVNILLAGEPIVGKVTLTCAPMFHVGGLNVTTLPTLLSGGHVILHETFDPARVIAEVEASRVTALWAAPAMLNMVAEAPGFGEADLSSLEVIICGGAPVPPVLIRVFHERGIKVCQGYGLTETTAFASLLGSADIETRPGSAGKPPVFGEVRIVDSAGSPVPAGDKGEVEVRGPMVFEGYWNRPEASREVLREDGWFRTGDIGYLDTEDYLFLSDRAKDVVISGGENVYPAEVEAQIVEHPSVVEVAVIGLPHEKWGEGVAAVVVGRQGSELTLDGLREFLDGRLARYKLPLFLLMVDSLPRNPAGKVLKYLLREQFRQEAGAAG